MRKLRKKFRRPKKAWDTDEIKEAKKLMAEYGLRRKKELFIAHEKLRSFRQRARELIGMEDKEKEKVLLDRLVRLGMLQEGQGLDDVLDLKVSNILDRRLQTIAFKRGIGKSIKHARQLIVHGKVYIDEKKITFPSYIVKSEEEGKIRFVEKKREKKKAQPEGKAAKEKPKEEKAGQKEKEAK